MRLWHLYLLAGLLALAELWSGPVAIDVGAALRATWEGRDSVDRIIVVDIRLPRLLLALLVGGALALSGAALQGLLRNPLASPDILGVSASAGLLAVLTLYFGLALAAWFVLPAAALAGAALAMLLLLRLTHRLPDTLALILSGIALTAGASALTTLATSLRGLTAMSSRMLPAGLTSGCVGQPVRMMALTLLLVSVAKAVQAEPSVL